MSEDYCRKCGAWTGTGALCAHCRSSDGELRLAKCANCGTEAMVSRTTARRISDNGRCRHCPRLPKGASKAPRGALRKPYRQLGDEEIREIWLLRNGNESGASIAKRYGVSPTRVSAILKKGRRCEGGCGRIATNESGRCKGCAPRRRPTRLTEQQREQIAQMRSRGMTYQAIADALDVSVSKVRKVVDPAFQGKRSSLGGGIQRVERRTGEVVFLAAVDVPGSRRKRVLGPFTTADEAEAGKREWTAQRLGVRRSPRKEQGTVSDVYGHVRLALKLLDSTELPVLRKREIFAALHEAEDRIRQALRDDRTGRYEVDQAA